MRQRFNRRSFLFLLFTLVGMGTFVYLGPRVFTLCPKDLRYNRSEILARAAAIAQQWGYDIRGRRSRIVMNHDRSLLRYIQRYHERELYPILLNRYPAYYWQVFWFDQKDKFKLVQSVDKNEPTFSLSQKGLSLLLDMQGGLIGFRYSGGVDSTVMSLRRARGMADSLMLRFSADKEPLPVFSYVNHVRTSNGSAFTFFYTFPQKNDGIGQQLQIKIEGNLVTSLELIYTPSVEVKLDIRSEEMSFIIFILLLLAVYAFHFIKRLRDDLIDFRTTAPVAVLMGITTTTMVLMVTWGVDLFSMVGSILTALVLAPMVLWLAYACGDSLARETWDDRLLTLDGLYKGFIYHEGLGTALLRGFGLGMMLLGMVTVLLYVAGSWVRLDLIEWSTDANLILTRNALLSGLSDIIYTTMWVQFGIILFATSLAAKYLVKPGRIVLAMSLFWGLGLHYMFKLPSHPLWLSMLIAAVIGAVQTVAFVRYDFFTSIVTQAAWISGFLLLQLLQLNHPTFQISVVGISVIWAVLLLLSLITWRRPVSERELRRYQPGPSRGIMARIRLRRELEIARQVQLNFLPKSTPTMPGLEVASVCEAALEVGGDYFDFIRLSDSRLGIAIGDVTGKGISAAFYMTLSKGFLRSLTHTITGPGEVMRQMNQLYWENVDRQHFISMIYGVFDTEQKSFTFVRAGHNPVIAVQNGQCTLLTPGGMALGLDDGRIFNRVVEERTIPLQAGDAFIFFTDGFSDARNTALQEFGEERLYQLIDDHKDLSAGDLVRTITQNVKKFVGQALEHDDMTMVIVRITA
jgi:sigma-B regulation protein RsbU (phosphoserine phosphatase)